LHIAGEGLSHLSAAVGLFERTRLLQCCEYPIRCYSLRL